MATLGNTTNGSGQQFFASDRKLASPFVAASSGTITDGGVRIWCADATTARLVIYSDSSGAPNALIAVSDDFAVNQTANSAYLTSTFTGSNQATITSGSTYWIGVQYAYPGASVGVRKEASGGGLLSNNDTFSDGASATFGGTASTTGAIDAYINYTEGVAASGDIKVYDGSSFVAKPVKYYDGTNWISKPLKRWTGTAWQVTDY